MDTTSNIFENFYRSFLVEKKEGIRQSVTRHRKLPIASNADNDFYLKSEILSDQDNKLKTESILSFLLDKDLFKYFSERIWPLYQEYNRIKNIIAKKYNLVRSNPADKIAISNHTQNLSEDDYGTLLVKCDGLKESVINYVKKQAKDPTKSSSLPISKDSILSTAFSVYNDYIKSNEYQNYRKKLNSARSFKNVYMDLLQIAKKPVTKKIDTPLSEADPRYSKFKPFVTKIVEIEPLAQIKFSDNQTDRDSVFSILEGVTDKTGIPGILNTKSVLIYLKNRGFTEDKLRDCVAFTSPMNNDDAFEMNKKHINGIIMNVFDPPRKQNEFIENEINNGKTLAEILQLPPVVQSYSNKLSFSANGSTYPEQKRKELLNILNYLFKVPTNVNDFYIKLGKILAFVENTNEISEDSYNENATKSALGNSAVKTNGFDLMESIRKEMKDALSSLPPIFGKIITLAQLLFTKNDKDTTNLSIQRLYNQTTGQYVNFIIPTYDLMSAIDRERYRLTFFAIDQYNGESSPGIKSLADTVSDVIYQPFSIDSDWKNLKNKTNDIDNVLKNTQHVDNTTIPKNQKKSFYVTDEDMDTFIKQVKNLGGRIIKGNGKSDESDDDAVYDIGDFINKNINSNAIVVFRGTNKENIEGGNDFAWKNTTVKTFEYKLDNGMTIHRYVIDTPVYSTYTAGINLNSLAVDDSNEQIDIDSIEKEVYSDLKISQDDYRTNNSVRSRANTLAAKKILFKMFEHNISNKFKEDSPTRKTVFGEKNENVTSFIDYFMSNASFSENIENPISFDSAIMDIRSFLVGIQSLITLSFIYYSLIMSKTFFRDEAPENKTNDTDKSQKQIKLTNEQYLERYCKIIENNFSVRARNLTARTLDGILNSSAPFHERTDFQRPLDNIITGILKTDFRFSQSEYYMVYLRQNNIKDATIVASLKDAIAEMIPTGIKQDVKVGVPNIDMFDEISDLNEIGHFVINILLSIKEQKKPFNYALDFKPSLIKFASILNDIENGTYNDNIKEALSETIKLYFAITYLMFLVLVVCNANQNLFVVTDTTINTTEAQKENQITQQEEKSYAYFGDQAKNFNVKTMNY